MKLGSFYTNRNKAFCLQRQLTKSKENGVHMKLTKCLTCIILFFDILSDKKPEDKLPEGKTRLKIFQMHFIVIKNKIELHYQNGHLFKKNKIYKKYKYLIIAVLSFKS